MESKISLGVEVETAPIGMTDVGRYAHLIDPGDGGFTLVIPNAEKTLGVEAAGKPIFWGKEALDPDKSPETKACHPEKMV